MLYDSAATNASFVDGRPPKDINEVLRWACEELPAKGIGHWRLISARKKLGRTLLEIEEETPSGPRRLIGKLGRQERAETLYNTLVRLRESGFRPPALLTVPEPIAYIPDRGFVLQEKVPGRQAGDLILQGSQPGRSAAADSAIWLAALHSCHLSPAYGSNDSQAVAQWIAELQTELQPQALRIGKLGEAILHELDKVIERKVPCHGDYHPMNIFIAGRQRITGIDMDKFARREAESDIGWFLMQTAAHGFFSTGTFDSTADARRTFTTTYEVASGQSIHERRTALYIAMAFLKNLRFELVLLKTGRTEYANPWLSGAEAAMFDGNLLLRAA